MGQSIDEGVLKLANGDHSIHWPGRTITVADNNFFCDPTLASSATNTDKYYALIGMAERKNIVFGTYIYTRLTVMSVPDISGLVSTSLEVRSLKYVMPVYPDDPIYGSTLILEKRKLKSNPNNVIATVETIGQHQNSDEVCVFERIFMVPKLDSK